jgi:hypothetical protein
MSDWYERERSRDRRSHHRGRSSSSDVIVHLTLELRAAEKRRA